MQTETVKQNRTNAIEGFLVHKLDPKVMKECAEDRELDVEGLSPEQTALVIVGHFRKVTNPGDLMACSQCKGTSDVELDECPLCGFAGDVAEGSEEELDDDEEDDEEVDQDAQDEEPEVVKAQVVDDEDEDDEDASSPDLEDRLEAAVAKGDKADNKTKMRKRSEVVSKKGSSKTMTTSGAMMNGKDAAAMTSRIKGNKKSVADLDKAVADIVKLKAMAGLSYWHLGQKILEIYTDQLWKLREEDGKPRYKGWEAFVHAEFKMTPMNANNLMDTAKVYNEAQVRAFGYSKLALTLKAAPEDRQEIVEQIEKGASKRQIEAKVQESRKRTGHKATGEGRTNKAKSKAGTASKGAARKEKISVANIEGRKTIKLFAKPDSMRGVDVMELTKRAKRLADIPFGWFELTNGVTQYFTVGEVNGELTLTVETRRAE